MVVSDPTGPSDPTFRSYSSSQAAAYAAGRGSYASDLYDFVLLNHQATGGGTGLVLDVGCGPGNATHDLARCFGSAIGVDPGDEMINTARELGGKTVLDDDIRFEVCAAENVDQIHGLAPNSVDLVTAAMAHEAHWFDMPKFWAAVAKILKPGGSVALWTHASLYCHSSTPNAAEVQRILSHLEDDILGPHVLPPNQLSRNLYRSLSLPWENEETTSAFEQSSFIRQEWDADGVLSDGKEFFGGASETTLASLKSALGTASMVTRWREANPQLAGTDQDCVELTMKRVSEAMGVKDGDLENVKLRHGSATVVLMVKRGAV